MFGITDSVVSLLGIPQQFDGAAGLTAESDASAAATRVVPATASLTAESVLAANGIYVGVASASLTGESALAADGLRFAVCAAALSAESNLAASATLVQPGASIVVGTSNLVAAATRVVPAVVGLSADGSLAAAGTAVRTGGAAGLTVQSDATAAAVIVKIASGLAMSAESDLPPVATLPIYRLVSSTTQQSYSENILLSRFPPDTASTVIVKDNVVTITEYPNSMDLDAADAYYLGGRRWQLTESEYQQFVAAGRTDLVEVA